MYNFYCAAKFDKKIQLSKPEVGHVFRDLDIFAVR